MRRHPALSATQKRALGVAAVAELCLKAFAAHDLAHRPAAEVRGPKIAWALALAVNLLGPLAYLGLGRR
jgi:photosystem II stability/assembly factor-like uncharacterized protein